jgi:hypothetical protein
MPFYIRKSVSAGPFRFNFSSSGVGVSVGVKGLRIGTGPRGHYVHAGRGGLYYRATLGRAGERKASASDVFTPALLPPRDWVDNVEMIEVESAEVLGMKVENLGALLDEINAKQAQLPMSAVLGWGFAAAGILILLVLGLAGAILLVAALPAWLVGRWIDSFKRTSVLYYDLGPEAEAAYTAVTDTFDQLASCHGKWHVEAGGAVRDLTTWKRNAGATNLVRKKPTTATYALPSVLRCNLKPPALHVGKQVIYFMPDAAFVVEAGKTGAVSYSELDLRWQTSNFIEDGHVPRDARVISHTWLHPNKNGGPDRRFAHNRQIPVCEYEALYLRSGSGLNELVEFSRTGVCQPFVSALRQLYDASGARLALPASA